jgi:hypothetical protein
MSQYNLVNNTSNSVSAAYEQLLVNKSTEYLLDRRFFIGKFSFDNFIILERLVGRGCNLHCETEEERELLLERTNRILLKSK